MMLVALTVLFVAVEQGCAAESDQHLYACPYQSWCVPLKYCAADMITFSSTAPRNFSVDPSDPYKFLCGVTEDTDGALCCRDLGALPEHFIPSRTHWHFLHKNSSVERLPMQVLAWPGYGTDEENPKEDEQKTNSNTDTPQVPFRGSLRFICPGSSMCVPAYDCPSEGIYYTVDVPSPTHGKFLCGVTEDSVGWLCCSLHVIKGIMDDRRRPAKIPVSNDHEALVRINFDVQKSHDHTGADVSYYSRTSHAAAPPPIPMSVIHLPDYYEDDHVIYLNDVLRHGRNYIELPKRRYRRDTGHDETSIDNEESKESYVIYGAADHGNATLHAVTHATLINDIPPAARSKIFHKEKSCGVPLEPYTPHAAQGNSHSLPLEGQYPWHVAVLTSTAEYLCGGVIVTERHVLTVAHCIIPRLPSQIVIRVGDFNLLSDSEAYPSYDVPVSRITCHPEYSRTTLRADVCVVQLRVAILWLPNVGRVCLPGETSHPDPTVECFVPSWGYVSRGEDGKIYDSFSPQLRHLAFLAIDGTRCQRELRKVKKLGSFFKLNSGVLCSKGTASPDTCHGDGGSGLVCRAGPDNQQGQYVLTGLVSWDMGCENGRPTAYVDVAYFLDFILRTTGTTLEDGRLHLGKTQAAGISDTNKNEDASTQYSTAYTAVPHGSEAAELGGSYQASGGSPSGSSHDKSSQSNVVFYGGSSQSDSSYGISSVSNHNTTSQNGYEATSHSDSSYGYSSHSGGSSYSATSHSDSLYNSNYKSQSSMNTAELPTQSPTFTTGKQGDSQNNQIDYGVHKVDPHLTGIPSRTGLPSRPSTLDIDNNSHMTNNHYDAQQEYYSTKHVYAKNYDNTASYEKEDYLHKYDLYNNRYEDFDSKLNNIQPEHLRDNGNRKYDKYDTGNKAGDNYDKYDLQDGHYAKDKYTSNYLNKVDRYGSESHGKGTYDIEFKVTNFNPELRHDNAHTKTSTYTYNKEFIDEKEYLNQDKPYHNDGQYYHPNDQQYYDDGRSYSDYDSKYLNNGKYYDIDFNKGKYREGQHFSHEDGNSFKDGKYYESDEKYGNYFERGENYDLKNGKYKDRDYYEKDYNHGRYYTDGKYYDHRDFKDFEGEYYNANHHGGKYTIDDKYFDNSDIAYNKEHGHDRDRNKYHGKYFDDVKYTNLYDYRQHHGKHYGHDMYYDYNAEYNKDIDYNDGKYYLSGGYYSINENGKYIKNGQYYDMDYKNGKYYKDGHYYDFDDHGRYYKDGNYNDVDFNHGKYYYNGNFYDYIDSGYYVDGKYYEIDYDDGKYYENGRYYSFNKRGQYLKDGKYYDLDHRKGKYYKDGRYHELSEHGKYYGDGNWYNIDYNHGKYYKDGEFYDLHYVATKTNGHKSRYDYEYGKNPDVENVFYYHNGHYYPYKEGKYFRDGEYYDVDPNGGKYYENGKYYSLNINGKYYKNGNYYDMDYQRGKYYKDGEYYDINQHGMYYKDGKYYAVDYNEGKFYSGGRHYGFFTDGHLYDYVDNGKYRSFQYGQYYDHSSSSDRKDYEDGPYAYDYYDHNLHQQYGNRPVKYDGSGSRYGGYGHNYINYFDSYGEYLGYEDRYFNDGYYVNYYGPDEFSEYYNGKHNNFNDQSYGEDGYTHKAYNGGFKNSDGRPSYKGEHYDHRDSKYYKVREIYDTSDVHYADPTGKVYDHNASHDNHYKPDHSESPNEHGVHYHYHYNHRKSSQGEKSREGQENNKGNLVNDASSEATEHAPVASATASLAAKAETPKEVKVSDNEIKSASPGSIVGYLKRLQVNPQ